MSQQAIAIAITCTFLRNTFKDIRMKPNEKKEVIALFSEYRKTPKAKYKALVKVLLELPNATPSQKRYANASRYSDANLHSLEYDIKKLCGITNSDISRAVKLAKIPAPKTGEQRLKEFNRGGTVEELKQATIDLVEFSKLNELLPNKLPEFSKGLPGNAERKKWLADNEVDHKLTKKDELQKLIESFHTSKVEAAYTFAITNLIEAQDALIKSEEEAASDQLADLDINIFKEAPEIVKQGIKFRDKYPFLSEENCPDEFKILVADMFTAYDNFRDGRKELKALIAAGASNEDIFEIARKTVADFELDLEIGDELEYYQEHGKILGEHPIFADKMLAEKIETMSTVELTKRQKNLRTYVSRDTKALNKMDDGEAKIKFEEKLQTFKDELALVDARLEKIS